MRQIEPFNLGKRLQALQEQLQRHQLASHATATEIAFHLKGTPQAAVFAGVLKAIELMDFGAARAAVDALSGAGPEPPPEPIRRSPETSLS